MKNHFSASKNKFFGPAPRKYSIPARRLRERVVKRGISELSHIFSGRGAVGMSPKHRVRWGIKVFTFAATCLAYGVTTSSTFAQTIGLYELARFNLNSSSDVANPEYIGSNPYAVAWNGSKLYVAGVNNTGATGTTAIVEVTNAGGVPNGTVSGFATPTYSTAFGQLSTGASSLGYRGLALNGGLLAAAWDNNANSANSYQLFNATTNTLNWNMSTSGISIRGSAVAFDPGYQGDPAQGGGFAFVNAGSGRRQLNDIASGTNIYNSTNGFFINNTAGQSTWRDMAFDPATGDVYMKATNLVTKSVRTGANATYPNSAAPETITLVNQTITTNIGSSLSFMDAVLPSSINAFSNPYAGNLIAYNNVAAPVATTWPTAINFVDTSGAAVTANWTFLSTPPTTASSIFDFSWDSQTQTLAVLDYTNRTVSIFSTAVPEPSSWAMLVMGGSVCGGAALRRRHSRRALVAQ
jgi:hypothetical protein